LASKVRVPKQQNGGQPSEPIVDILGWKFGNIHEPIKVLDSYGGSVNVNSAVLVEED
jgi:hypothetical protein